MSIEVKLATVDGVNIVHFIMAAVGRVSVWPDARGIGIGKSMLDFIEDRARAMVKHVQRVF